MSLCLKLKSLKAFIWGGGSFIFIAAGSMFRGVEPMTWVNFGSGSGYLLSADVVANQQKSTENNWN